MTTITNIEPAWLDRSLYPFESRYIEIDGLNLHYIDEGKGPIILFLHANPLWSFTYRELIKDLRSDFRCLALDYPGFGLSEKGSDFELGLENNSQLVQSFMEQLDLPPVIIYTHDASVSIGLGVAQRRPELVRAAVVSNSFAWPLDPYPAVRRFVAVAASGPFSFLNRAISFMLRYINANMFRADGSKYSDSEKQAVLGPFQKSAHRVVIARMFRSILESNAYLGKLHTDMKKKADLPVLILFGDEDATFEAGWHEMFRKTFKQHKLAIIPGGHHFPHEYAPNQVVDHFRQWYADLK